MYSYYWLLLLLEIVTRNHIIVYKLLALDKNTWNHTIMCKLFVLDKNTWYHITVCKHMNIEYNLINASSSSSYCTTSTDLSDPLPPLFSIVHRSRLVFKAISCIGTELLYVGSSWSSCLCSSMWKGSQEYVTYEFVPTSPAVSHMSGPSNLDSFGDGW